MKRQKLYKITNQMLNDTMICAKDIKEAIDKYDKINKEKQTYEKTISCIECLGEVYFGD